MPKTRITSETKAPGMTSGRRKWKSFEDMADWTCTMLPRLIKNFGLKYWFKLHYEMTDDLAPNVLGDFSIKYDEENKEFYGLIRISADLTDKKDILSVALHELIHGHCIAHYTFKFMQKDITKEEFEKLYMQEAEHEGMFATLCREIGFGSDMTATKAKPALVRRLLALDFE